MNKGNLVHNFTDTASSEAALKFNIGAIDKTTLNNNINN